MDAATNNAHAGIVTDKWKVTLFSSADTAARHNGQHNDSCGAQFTGRDEFLISRPGNEEGILPWSALQALTLHAKECNNNHFILCSTAHRFSVNYSARYLKECIVAAEENKADMLLGSVNWFDSVVQISGNLFWLDRFRGMQFIILFKRFYDAVLTVGAESGHTSPERLLSSIAANKLLLYPFISVASEGSSFWDGESDASYANPEEQLELLQQVKKYYLSINTND